MRMNLLLGVLLGLISVQSMAQSTQTWDSEYQYTKALNHFNSDVRVDLAPAYILGRVVAVGQGYGDLQVIVDGVMSADAGNMFCRKGTFPLSVDITSYHYTPEQSVFYQISEQSLINGSIVRLSVDTDCSGNSTRNISKPSNSKILEIMSLDHAYASKLYKKYTKAAPSVLIKKTD